MNIQRRKPSTRGEKAPAPTKPQESGSREAFDPGGFRSAARSAASLQQAEREWYNLGIVDPGGYKKEAFLKKLGVEISDGGRARGRRSARSSQKIETGGPPRDLHDSIGRLDFYDQRSRDFERRNPGATPPAYYAYASKYAKRFNQDVAPFLSSKGREWVGDVTVALQKKIEERRQDFPGNFEALEFAGGGELLRAAAVGDHAKAYLDAGLANLPVSDLVTIKQAIEPIDRDAETERKVTLGVVVGKLLPGQQKRAASTSITRRQRHFRQIG